MDIPPRQFICVGCRKQVLICSHCDRSNRYCSKDCWRPIRKLRQRAAGQRYQTSQRGRIKHALRQHRYRARRANNVTHQGSPAAQAPVQCQPEPIAVVVPGADRGCCTCKRPVSPFVRL